MIPQKELNDWILVDVKKEHKNLSIEMKSEVKFFIPFKLSVCIPGL